MDSLQRIDDLLADVKSVLDEIARVRSGGGSPDDLDLIARYRRLLVKLEWAQAYLSEPPE